jgi:hypothetical protein
MLAVLPNGLARPLTAVGGDGLYKVKITRNIMKPSSEQPIGGGPTAWRLDGEKKFRHRKKNHVKKCYPWSQMLLSSVKM